jgi:hypothetical protein
MVTLYRRFRSHHAHGTKKTGVLDPRPSTLRSSMARRIGRSAINSMPNQLGVEYNARLLETVVRDIAPALG